MYIQEILSRFGKKEAHLVGTKKLPKKSEISFMEQTHRYQKLVYSKGSWERKFLSRSQDYWNACGNLEE